MAGSGMFIPGMRRPEDDPTQPPAPPAPAAPGAPVTVQFAPRPEVSQTSNWRGPSTTTQTTQANPLATQQAEKMEIATANENAARAREAEAAARATEEQAIGDERLAENARYYQSIRENERVRRDEQIRSLMAVEAQRRQEVEATAKPTDGWADKSAPAKLLSAFLVGLGGFAAGGGENKAYTVLQDQLARDRQTKLDMFQRSKEFLALAQRDRAAAQDALENRIKEIDSEEIVQRNILQKQIDAVAKRMGVPQALAAAEAMRERNNADAAEKLARHYQNYDAKITRDSGHSGGSSTVNINQPGDAPRPPGFNERKDATAAADAAGNMDRLAELIEKNPKAWAEYQTALRSQAESDAAGGSTILKEGKAALQSAGLSPTSIDQRLKSPEAREIHSAMTTVIGTKAKELDPTSAPSDTTLNAASRHLGLSSRSPKEIATEVRRLAERARGQQQAAVPPQQSAPPQQGGITREIDGKRFVKVNGKWKVLE